jgi:hypothetical protein
MRVMTPEGGWSAMTPAQRRTSRDEAIAIDQIAQNDGPHSICQNESAANRQPVNPIAKATLGQDRKAAGKATDGQPVQCAHTYKHVYSCAAPICIYSHAQIHMFTMSDLADIRPLPFY